MNTGMDHFSKILNNSYDGIIVVDMEGIVLCANPSTEKILNRSNEEIVGKAFGFPVSSGDDAEIQIRQPNGSFRTAELRSVKIEWQDRGAYLINIRDITERKLIEQELETHRNHLNKLVEEKTEELQRIVNVMTGREIRMADLKEYIDILKQQLSEAGIRPASENKHSYERKVPQ